jgi:FlaA1/EpsC-like NDP-sugar epimerase
MSQAPVIVIGAGGHAVVVADALLAAGRTVLGFVDDDPAKAGSHVLGLPVLGNDAALKAHLGRGIELANGIGGPLRERAKMNTASSGCTFCCTSGASDTLTCSA